MPGDRNLIAPDAGIRNEVLDTGRSFVLSAPAGSGKTELLIQRVLALLARCDKPEELLAITFTRKAADEMRERILRALTQADQQTPIASDYQQQTRDLAAEALTRDRELNWNLLQNPGRLRIQTIDSFCAQLAEQTLLDSGIAVADSVSENPEILYRNAARNCLKALGSNDKTGRALRLILGYLDNNLAQLESLISQMLAKRAQWLYPVLHMRRNEARDFLQQSLTIITVEALETLNEYLSSVASDLLRHCNYAGTNARAEDPATPLQLLAELETLPACEAELLDNWQALVSLFLTQSGTWRKQVNKNQGYPVQTETIDKNRAKALKDEWKELLDQIAATDGVLEAMTEVQRLAAPQFDDVQWAFLAALIEILPIAASHLSLEFQGNNQCDFTAQSLTALEALGDPEKPTDLALRLDYRIRHILVDEFQDTSSLQFNLLRKLTAGWQAEDGRTLFLVGDGMQSIYGFRDANVGLFIAAQHQGIGDIDLQSRKLTANFRSQAGIVSWVNDRFRRLFPAVDQISQGAVAYIHSEAVHPIAETPAVTVSAFDSAQSEAVQVAEWIRELLRDDPTGEVAILVRARSHLTAILPALRAAGLQWQATEIDPLAGRQAVIDAHSLSRALLCPGDRVAWLALLRAPFCGLDNNDLFWLVNVEYDCPGRALPTIWQQIQNSSQHTNISENGIALIARLSTLLKKAFLVRGQLLLREWLENTWLQLGGAASLLESCDLANVQSYFDLVEQFDDGGNIADWPEFENALSRLYAASSGNTDSRIKVMTLYKAKGLEFDNVIVPGLARRMPSDETPLFLWREQETESAGVQLLMVPRPSVEESKNPLFDYLKHKLKQQQLLENVRLMYVAATRAKMRLFLATELKWNEEKQQFNEPGENTLAGALWPALGDEFLSSIRPPSITDSNNQNTFLALSDLRRLTTDWQSPQVLPSILESDSNRVRTSDNLIQRQLGVILHRTLHQITRDKLESWIDSQLGEKNRALLRELWKIHLREAGFIGDQQNELLEKLKGWLDVILADARGRWILDHQHLESASELEIDYLDAGGRLKQAIVDRTFICEGQRWIIDYKTSSPDTSETVERFLAREAERYSGQLRHYASLFQSMEDLPVKTALYFPAIAAFYEINH